MTTSQVKAFNVYGEERGNRTFFYLERLDFKHPKWVNCGATSETREVSRDIANIISVSGTKLDFYNLEPPYITNSPPKVSGRDYGVILGRYGDSSLRFEKPTLIRALTYDEFKEVYESFDEFREKAREIEGIIKGLIGDDKKILPETLQRYLWDRVN